MGHYGLDISSNQPHPVDWPRVVADLTARGGGRPFVIVKATQGTGYVNPDEPADAAGAAQAGAAVGAYLMDQGNADPAAEQALYRRIAGTLPQFDDDELPMGNTAYAQHCAQLLAQNPAAGDYLNQSEEDQGFPPGAVPWEANYNGEPGVTHRSGVLIHQYTSTGTVAGIAGAVDLNFWVGTDAQFAQVFHLPSVYPGGKMSACVGMIPDPKGRGYWLVQPDGGVFNHSHQGQTLPFFGSLGGKQLAAPIIGGYPTPDGGGYWLVGADGGVFAFGNAPFDGAGTS